jgi:transcriptional antiterminator RfaH
LFIRIVDRWHIIESTIGVTKVLTSGGAPARLRDEIVSQIKSREVSGLVKLPSAAKRFHRGDRLAIAKGSFRGHVCLFEGMSAHDRVSVLLELLGRKVRLEIPISDVAPAQQAVAS